MGVPIGFYNIKDMSGGMVTEVVDSLTPVNTMRLILNMDIDVIGGARVREGNTAIGNQLEDGKNILGVYNFRDAGSGGNSQQIAAVNDVNDSVSVLEYNNGGVWTGISGGGSRSANAKHRFATFLDRVFTVNSVFDTPLSWDGNPSNAFDSTQLSSAPSGQFITTYKSRLYIAGESANPDRVYFSSIVSSAGNITWDTAEGFLTLNPSDGLEGGDITGLAKNGTLLLIFKDRGMYRWNGSSTDPELVIDVGCSSQESIATRNGITFFFNPFGVYATNGGQPKAISQAVQRWVDGMSGSFYANVSGCCDEKNYYCSIGDSTVDGQTYSNVVLVYHIPSRTWVVRSYPYQIRCMTNFIGSDETAGIMVGNNDGLALEFNEGTTDNGAAIPYRLRTKRIDFGHQWALNKRFTDFSAFGDNLEGAHTDVFTDSGERPASVRELLYGLWQRMKGYRFRGRWFQFELSGVSQSGRGLFHGWEISDPQVDEPAN